MRAHRKALFLALILLATIPMPVLAIDEVIDDYEDTSKIDIMIQTVHNATFDAVELNMTGISENLVLAESAWREHDYYGAAAVNNFDKDRGMTANDFRARTFGTGFKGIFHGAILVVNREWLHDKYIRWLYWTWFPSSTSGITWTFWRMYVYDGAYDYTSDTDFPDGSFLPIKGGGQLHAYVPSLDDNIWVTSDRLIDTSAGTETYCTIFIMTWDFRNDLNTGFILSNFQINGGAGGADNLWEKTFTNPPEDCITERSGTEKDYGYIDETVSLTSGGYSPTGYMITENILDGIAYEGTVLLTNTSIPSGSINVEVSEDGSTWSDLGTIEDGNFSKDLRDLKYDEAIIRFNFTRGVFDFEETPRLYQIRLIHEAPCVGNGDVYLTGSIGIFLIAFIILLPIIFYAVKRR